MNEEYQKELEKFKDNTKHWTDTEVKEVLDMLDCAAQIKTYKKLNKLLEQILEKENE